MYSPDIPDDVTPGGGWLVIGALPGGGTGGAGWLGCDCIGGFPGGNGGGGWDGGGPYGSTTWSPSSHSEDKSPELNL